MPSAVGVLAGPAPVLWIHGAADIAAIADTLAVAPEVQDVYASAKAEENTDRLVADGWLRGERMTQLVGERADWSGARPGSPRVHELDLADLTAFRRTLADATGAPERLLDSSYGDDFFERAKPAWLFGAYDNGRMVGTVGMRLQQESAMLFALGVEPRYRGSGIAQELVRAAVDRAFGVGATFVHALVERDGLEVGLACGARPIATWQHLMRD